MQHCQFAAPPNLQHRQIRSPQQHVSGRFDLLVRQAEGTCRSTAKSAAPPNSTAKQHRQTAPPNSTAKLHSMLNWILLVVAHATLRLRRILSGPLPASNLSRTPCSMPSGILLLSEAMTKCSRKCKIPIFHLNRWRFVWRQMNPWIGFTIPPRGPTERIFRKP